MATFVQPELIIKSLQDPKFTWRTPNGISKDTGIEVEDVVKFLEGSDSIIRSSSANTAGQPLYTLRDRYKDATPLTRRILNAIANST